jgi:hypothetical protein
MFSPSSRNVVETVRWFCRRFQSLGEQTVAVGVGQESARYMTVILG